MHQNKPQDRQIAVQQFAKSAGLGNNAETNTQLAATLAQLAENQAQMAQNQQLTNQALLKILEKEGK